MTPVHVVTTAAADQRPTAFTEVRVRLNISAKAAASAIGLSVGQLEMLRLGKIRFVDAGEELEAICRLLKLCAAADGLRGAWLPDLGECPKCGHPPEPAHGCHCTAADRVDVDGAQMQGDAFMRDMLELGARLGDKCLDCGHVLEDHAKGPCARMSHDFIGEAGVHTRCPCNAFKRALLR